MYKVEENCHPAAALLTDRQRQIYDVALPIVGGMMSQNVMNIVDTAMVGTQGRFAVAAVGISNFAAFMAQAFLIGLSAGVQAMAARRLGQKALERMAIPLNGGLLLALILGVPLTVLLYSNAEILFPYLNGDPQVASEGVPYLKARFLGIVGVGMNFAFRGYFNGVNRSRMYLTSLVIMHVCNMGVSYAFIFGAFGAPALGTEGAAVGTTTATFVGTGVYFFLAWRHARQAGFLRGLPDRAGMVSMLKLSLPNGVQQLFFAAGMTLLFWIVGRTGTSELAAASIIITLMLFAILPGMGLGLACASLVGQALGRKDPADAERWGWDVVKIATTILAFIGLPMLLAPEMLLDLFIDDPATIAAGALPLRIIGFSIALDGTGLVLQNALLGAGDSVSVMVTGVGLQWLVMLPGAYLVGVVWGYGLVGIWMVLALQRLVQAVSFAAIWKRGRWKSIEV